MAWTVRTKLIGLGLGAFIALGGISVMAVRTIGHLVEATAAMRTFGEGLVNHQNGDMMHDALRGDVHQALLLSEGGRPDPKEAEEARAALREHVQTFRRAMEVNRALGLPADLARDL